MAKYDPKLLKQITPSKLIAAATEIGIQNPEKVQKETLIDAFLDAVEKRQDEGILNSSNVVNLYNDIVKILGLLGEEAPPEPEPEPEPEPPLPPPAAAPPAVARRGRPAAPAAPAPVAPAPAVAKLAPAAATTPVAKKEKKPAPPTRSGFSRWAAFGMAAVEMKSGKIDDLIKKANEVYIAHNGKSNPRESATVAKFSLSVLKAMGYASVTEDSFSLTK